MDAYGSIGYGSPPSPLGLLRDAKAGKNPFEGLTPEVGRCRGGSALTKRVVWQNESCQVPPGERLSESWGPGSKAYADFEIKGMAQVAKLCRWVKCPYGTL